MPLKAFKIGMAALLVVFLLGVYFAPEEEPAPPTNLQLPSLQ